MRYIFNEGGLWEESQFEIHTDCHLGDSYNEQPCKHCYIDSKGKWLCPSIVIATNEGGYNSTGVCLNCIIEASKTIN